MPRSGHNPQFNSEALAYALKQENIAYVALPALGGLRRPRKDSPNTGWRNESFRGYADYMQTEEFQEGLESLIDMSRQKRVAIMCAEALPWRCHRSLVADALSIRDIPVVEILPEERYRMHKLRLLRAWKTGKLRIRRSKRACCSGWSPACTIAGWESGGAPVGARRVALTAGAISLLFHIISILLEMSLTNDSRDHILMFIERSQHERKTGCHRTWRYRPRSPARRLPAAGRKRR